VRSMLKRQGLLAVRPDSFGSLAGASGSAKRPLSLMRSFRRSSQKRARLAPPAWRTSSHRRRNQRRLSCGSSPMVSPKPEPSKAALKFVTPPRNLGDLDDQSHQKDAASDTVELSPQQIVSSGPETQLSTAVKHESSTPPAYQPFSTRLRCDLKRRLKRLSHYREDAGHEAWSVQEFVELAISDWLDRQDEPPEA